MEPSDNFDELADMLDDAAETEIIKLTVAGHAPIYLEVPKSYTEDERSAFQAGLMRGIEVGVFVSTGEEHQVHPLSFNRNDDRS